MLVALLALACKPADTDVVDTDPRDTEVTDAIAVPDSNLSNVLGDCEGSFREPDAYPNQLIRGDELQRYFVSDPQAVCNDGSRGVAYVRPATDTALTDVWSIHLQGGGGCGSWEACAARYCGSGYYDASKMSSRWAPETIGGVGIYDADPANVLAGANQIYLYYCSSDGWTGQGTTTYVDETGANPSFTQFSRGHLIVASLIDDLRAGQVIADGGFTMPDLDDASVVLFSGTSAGATGARAHADWLSELLAPGGAQVKAIFDAANDPDLDAYPAERRAEAHDLYRRLYDSGLQSQDVAPFVDASCDARWGGTDDAYLCSVDPFVLRNHITTPYFVRQDLRDVTGMGEALDMSVDAYEALQQASLTGLPAAAAAGLEPIDFVPGVYGPNCAQHVALESTDWWRVATLTGGGAASTFQDAVRAWWRTGDAVRVDEVAAGDVPGPGSVCPHVDDER